MLRAVLVCVLVALVTGCPAPQSSRCKEVCRRMVRCIEAEERPEVVIDENECTATCTTLERDVEGKKRVDEHAQCVDRADNDCAALLACP